MTICAAFGCSSRSGRDKVSFFSFPKDKALRRTWIERLDRGTPGNRCKPYVPTSFSKLCSKHFDDRQFTINESLLSNIGCSEKFFRSLKPDAVPSIFEHRPKQLRNRRQSAETIQQKKKKKEIVQGCKIMLQPVGMDGVSEEPLVASPVDNEQAHISSLETLVSVACSKSRLPVPVWRSTYHVQCQTPNWPSCTKEVQVSVRTETRGTQTDWPNDVPLVTEEMGGICQSPDETLFSELSEDSLRRDSLDSTWIPSDSDDDDKEDMDSFNSDSCIGVRDRKFIVYESQLEDLLDTCKKCSSKLYINKTLKGCLLTCEMRCHVCSEDTTWTSQPCSGTLPLGHIDLAAGIMYSGSGTARFLRVLHFAGVTCFSEATFFNIQNCYLIPAVFKVWNREQYHHIEAIKQQNRKFIVYESQLEDLLDTCKKCSSKLYINKTLKGCLLTCEMRCHVCSEDTTWTSQPCSGTLPLGHIDLAAGIMYSGSGTARFLRVLHFAGVTCFSEATFFNIQNCYLIPAVFKVWNREQYHHIEAIKQQNRKFIVYESQLEDLLDTCKKCSSKLYINKTLKGCLLTCEMRCHVCSEDTTWTSQPCSGTLPLGHIDLAAGIMYSGSGTARFLRVLHFAGVTCFSEATFFNIQNCYLIPAVFKVWNREQYHHIEAIKQQGNPLKIVGDGRCCSPGHTAKYCTYSMMDLGTGKILDLQLLQSKEVKNTRKNGIFKHL